MTNNIKTEPDLDINDYNGDYEYHIVQDDDTQLIKTIKTEDQIAKDDNNNSNKDIKTLEKCKKSTKTSKNKKTSLKCKLCKRTFPHKSGLHRHQMQIHSFEKPLKCDICRETFIDKFYLTSHMRKHSKTSAFTCKTCGKEFNHAFNFKKHLRVHNGLRPFKCTECEKTYKHSSHLKRHMISHTAEAMEKAKLTKKRTGRPIKISAIATTIPNNTETAVHSIKPKTTTPIADNPVEPKIKRECDIFPRLTEVLLGFD